MQAQLNLFELALTPRSGESFDTNDIAKLRTWLEARGFTPDVPRSSYVAARLVNERGALIVIYHSGAVSVQGQGKSVTMALLEELVYE